MLAGEWFRLLARQPLTRGFVMALREYTLNGSTFLLDQKDAALLGATPVRANRAPAPANKARRTVRNKKTEGVAREPSSTSDHG